MGTHTPKYSVGERDQGMGRVSYAVLVEYPNEDGSYKEPQPIATGLTYKHAAHIVKCVNGWDEQQANIDELVDMLSKIIGNFNGGVLPERKEVHVSMVKDFGAQFYLSPCAAMIDSELVLEAKRIIESVALTRAKGE